MNLINSLAGFATAIFAVGIFVADVLILLLGLLPVCGLLAAEPKSDLEDGPKGLVWASPVPEDCPFKKSTSLTGLCFTGRHSDYHCGDTWYPSWASDGNLYSPWTDGTTEGVECGSGPARKPGPGTR